jgi:hypothetical protein
MLVLQNDNEQIEQENSLMKERLKQLVDDILQKKFIGTLKTSGSPSKRNHSFDQRIYIIDNKHILL